MHSSHETAVTPTGVKQQRVREPVSAGLTIASTAPTSQRARALRRQGDHARRLWLTMPMPRRRSSDPRSADESFGDHTITPTRVSGARSRSKPCLELTPRETRVWPFAAARSVEARLVLPCRARYSARTSAAHSSSFQNSTHESAGGRFRKSWRAGVYRSRRCRLRSPRRAGPMARAPETCLPRRPRSLGRGVGRARAILRAEPLSGDGSRPTAEDPRSPNVRSG
jgi:hypothetical protein